MGYGDDLILLLVGWAVIFTFIGMTLLIMIICEYIKKKIDERRLYKFLESRKWSSFDE